MLTYKTLCYSRLYSLIKQSIFILQCNIRPDVCARHDCSFNLSSWKYSHQSCPFFQLLCLCLCACPWHFLTNIVGLSKSKPSSSLNHHDPEYSSKGSSKCVTQHCTSIMNTKYYKSLSSVHQTQSINHTFLSQKDFVQWQEGVPIYEAQPCWNNIIIHVCSGTIQPLLQCRYTEPLNTEFGEKVYTLNLHLIFTSGFLLKLNKYKSLQNVQENGPSPLCQDAEHAVRGLEFLLARFTRLLRLKIILTSPGMLSALTSSSHTFHYSILPFCTSRPCRRHPLKGASHPRDLPGTESHLLEKTSACVSETEKNQVGQMEQLAC